MDRRYYTNDIRASALPRGERSSAISISTGSPDDIIPAAPLALAESPNGSTVLSVPLPDNGAPPPK